MPTNRLGDKEREEWKAVLALSEDHHRRQVVPTQEYERLWKDNAAHWPNLDLDSRGEIIDNDSWPYEAITSNKAYAAWKSTKPRVLLRHPKVLVRPASRVTKRFGAISEDPMMRFIGAAFVQQILNWRVREFDFKKQVGRAFYDDFHRGLGVVWHGYMADTERRDGRRNRQLEIFHHQHIRPGWPFAVHQHLAGYRWDTLARDPDERQWAARADMWRLDDLKKDPRFSVPREMKATHVAGRERGGDDKDDFYREHMDHLGRVEVWNIWDRRTKRVIYWVGESGKEIGVEEWPLDFEGLPDSLFRSNESNDGVELIPEQKIVRELQMQLNKLISMILIYAKRGVPIVVFSNSQIDQDEVDKYLEAEILEAVQAKGDVNKALAMHNLQPVPQTLLIAAQTVSQEIREITGTGRMGFGARENVETAQEASQIQQGMDVRMVDRITSMKEGFERVIRKDWQLMQQTLNEPMVMDIVDTSRFPQLFEVTRDQIQMEYDMEIQVGSTEPDNEHLRKRDAMALSESTLNNPALAREFSPRAIARILADAFGWGESEIMATQEASQQQAVVDKLEGALFKGGNGAGGRGSGAALDMMKSTQGRGERA